MNMKRLNLTLATLVLIGLNPVMSIRWEVDVSMSTSLTVKSHRSKKKPKFEVPNFFATKAEACKELVDLHSLGGNIAVLKEEGNDDGYMIALARFLVQLTKLRTFMEFFQNGDDLAVPCDIPGLVNSSDDFICTSEVRGPGCLQCVIHNFRYSAFDFKPNCSWLFENFQESQTQIVSENTKTSTQSLPTSTKYVTFANCTMETLMEEDEARVLFEELLETYDDVLSVLNEAQMFIPDMLDMLRSMQPLWEPTSETNRRKRRQITSIIGQAMAGIQCDLNANDDPLFLTEQFENALNTLSTDLTNSAYYPDVVCYLVRLNGLTIQGVLEHGVHGSPKDSTIALKLENSINQSNKFTVMVGDLRSRFENAKANVSEALTTNADYVYVCVT